MDSINSTQATNNVALIPNEDQISAQFGGDTAAELAAMVFLFARDRKSEATEQRELVEDRIRNAQDKQVEQMYEQADDLMTSGWLGGFGMMASGGGQLLGGMSTLDGFADPLMSDGQAGARQSLWQGGGSAVGGASQVLASGYEHAAGNHEAGAQRASNTAAAAERDLEEVKDSREDAQELNTRALDFLEQVQEQKAEAEQSIWVKA